MTFQSLGGASYLNISLNDNGASSAFLPTDAFINGEKNG